VFSSVAVVAEAIDPRYTGFSTGLGTRAQKTRTVGDTMPDLPFGQHPLFGRFKFLVHFSSNHGLLCLFRYQLSYSSWRGMGNGSDTTLDALWTLESVKAFSK
jgi:hypothetical protein